MSIIYLIRHGQTSWNKEEIFRGQQDIPLNDCGRQQARAAGKELEKRGIDTPLFFTSPLKRARETAEIIKESIDPQGEKELNEVPGFNDINFGLWEGKSRDEVREQYPELYRKWEQEPHNVIFPGGEKLSDAAERAAEALLEVALKIHPKDALVVSHRAVNKVLFCHLLGAGPKAFWLVKQDTGCINILQKQNDNFILVTLNDTCHLLSIGRGDKKDF